MSEARKNEPSVPTPSGPEAATTESQAGLFERLRALFGIEPASVRDDIEDALEDDTGPNGDFTPQERAILKNVLALHEVRVADVMVPRADVVAVQIDSPLSDVLTLFRTAGHSRLPVYGETLDDPRGMVHIRDFVDYLAAAPQFGLAPEASSEQAAAPFDMSLPLAKAKILRPVLFAPPSMPALDLLLKMQATRTHMALVIDEYGGADGLVSIEDVVEAIVGDIEDEHDETETPAIEKTPEGAFIADARVSLEDASQVIGADFSNLADAEDVDTVGGLVTAKAGRVPGRGEIVTGIGGYEFEILDADPRRVKRVKIHRIATPPKKPAPRRKRDAAAAPNAEQGAADEA
jgi:CBS domain containing-hemolysin-like protein